MIEDCKCLPPLEITWKVSHEAAANALRCLELVRRVSVMRQTEPGPLENQATALLAKYFDEQLEAPTPPAPIIAGTYGPVCSITQ